MMRGLSQYLVSRAIDRGGKPSALWRHTFGRLASHQQFASQMNQLDAQLKRQATSQRRAIAREQLPVGRYAKQTVPADATATDTALPPALSWLRPTLTYGSFAAVLGLAVVGLVIWANTPKHSPEELRAMAAQSFDRVWQPLSRQAESTGRALRDQTAHVTNLPHRLPEMDRVVNDLGVAIQSPIQEEVRRFTDDLTRPWSYLADQLPKLPGERGAQPDAPRES